LAQTSYEEELWALISKIMLNFCLENSCSHEKLDFKLQKRKILVILGEISVFYFRNYAQIHKILYLKLGSTCEISMERIYSLMFIFLKYLM